MSPSTAFWGSFLAGSFPFSREAFRGVKICPERSTTAILASVLLTFIMMREGRKIMPMKKIGLRIVPMIKAFFLTISLNSFFRIVLIFPIFASHDLHIDIGERGLDFFKLLHPEPRG